MGMRYYCPWLGRWTTADPLGLQAGINLYLYCRAGPVVFSDPSGLQEGFTAQNPGEKEQVVEDRSAPSKVRSESGPSVGGAHVSPTSWLGRLVEQAGIAQKQDAAEKKQKADLKADQDAKDIGAYHQYEAAHDNQHFRPGPSAPVDVRPYTLFPESEEDRDPAVERGYKLAHAGVEPPSSLDVAGHLAQFAIGEGELRALRGAAKPAGVSTEYSLIKSREYAPDLGGVTGKTARVRNATIENLMEKDLAGVRFTHKPQYNPGLEQFGVAQRGEGSQLGARAFESKEQIMETMAHEELHHRWWARGIVNHHADPILDQRFENIVQRFMDRISKRNGG